MDLQSNKIVTRKPVRSARHTMRGRSTWSGDEELKRAQSILYFVRIVHRTKSEGK